MIRRLALCLLFIAPMARAEVLTLRSGDHPSFARIVVAIPAGADWQVGRVDQGYALQLDPAHSFDTTGVFDRIRRDRLSAVRGDGGAGRLIFTMACACHADAFLFRPDMLVIDIKDGPPERSSAFEARLGEAAGPAAPPVPLLAEPAQGGISAGTDLLPDPLSLTAATAPGVTAAEQNLLESLARAASQGLLEVDQTDLRAVGPARSDVLPTNPIDMVADVPGLDVPGVGPAEPPMPVILMPPGLQIQTTIDRDRPSQPPVGENTDGGACLEDRHFDFASWSTSDDFGREIGSRRATLTTDRDQFPDGAVEALSRTYLYFGFGREAAQALSLDSLRSTDRDIIRTMAQIVDGDPVTGTALSGQDGCTRPVALWAALARQSLLGTTEAERIAIQTTHRALPATIRPWLGERLARLFLDAGDAATADAIIRLESGQTDEEPDATLTSAAITLETNGPDAALATLGTLVTDDSRKSPETVIALIEISLAENVPVADDVLALADALRFENRGTPAELDLADATFRALLATDHFAEAEHLLTEIDRLSPSNAEGHRTDLIVAIAQRMPNAPFLDAIFEHSAHRYSTKAANAVARRLLDLGFVDQAANLVASPATGEVMAERRYLRAEAAIMLQQYDMAQEALTGMTDPRAMALLALIPVNGGDGPDQTGTDPAVPGSEGSWAQLESDADPLIEAASAALLTRSTIPGPDSTLAERQTLIAEAEATRALAADLLARFPIDAAIPAAN